MGLAQRLWLALVLPITVALGLYGVMSHQSRYRILRSEASAELRNHATLVEAAIGGAVERGQMDVLRQRIERLARADRILGIAAFDAAGAPILITGPIIQAAPDLALLARRALESGGELEEESDLLTGGRALMHSVTFSPRPDGLAVVAVVVRDLRYLDEFARSMNQWLLITGALLLGVTALITALATRVTVGRPVGALVAGVERVSGGDLKIKVPEAGAEELQRLARVFNAMTTSLADAKARVETEEAARVAMERKLQHAQALAAVGQVAASIGHEIGSPLAVILGRAQRAAQKRDCPEDLRAELETIAAQSERISRVVARLLAAARPAALVTRGSDLVRVAQEVVAFLGPECRQRSIRLRFERGEGPASVALGDDQLFQVIFNLCLNAIQAQREGGEIIVRTAAQGGRPERARRVLVEIEDHGPGVPPEIAEHLFDAFFTSKGDRGGSGLGLTIVRGIVREAGGTVELVPTEHGGACFRVTLLADLPRQPPGLVEARS